MALYLDTTGELLTDLSGGLIMNLCSGKIILPLTPPTPPTDIYRLLEDDSFRLLEDGTFKRLTEQ